MASALLAGLIITNLGGAGWSDLNWQQVLGVGTAGLARALKAPMLLAVGCGIAATALLRHLLA
jgi:branched chain amino acid efflux pump